MNLTVYICFTYLHTLVCTFIYANLYIHGITHGFACIWVLFHIKKDRGGLRMYINCSILNSNIFNNAWLIPCIDNLLACLHRAKFFLKLELYKGYHQIPPVMDPSSLG